MIVDNESVIRNGLSQCIDWQSMGCEVILTADDGIDALQKLKRAQVDIVISDIRMPRMDGLELAAKIIEEYPHIKVIILTGYSDFNYAQEAIKHRVVDFILKPTSEEKLHKAILRAKERLFVDQDLDDLQKSLEEKEKLNLTLKQSLFLESLLDQNDLVFTHAQEQSRLLGMNFTTCFILDIMSVVAIDQSPEHIEMQIRDAEKFLSHVFDINDVRLISRGQNGFLLFVFNTSRKVLTEQLEKYVMLIDNITEYSVRIGISGPCIDALHVSQIAKESSDAKHYLELDDSRSYMFYSDIPALSNASREVLFDLLKRIDGSLQNQSLEEFQSIISEFEMLLYKDHIPFPEVRSFIEMVYNLCVGTLLKYDISSFQPNHVLDSLDTLLNGMSLNNMSKRTLNIAKQVFQVLKNNVTDTPGLISFIKGYIHTNFEQEFSLEVLAGVAYLSPTYLSKLFKKNVGENISSYIQHVRIDKAKEMLRLTTNRNYEVAKAVGIDDPVYFSRLFKKHTGMKPSDYRKIFSEVRT